MMKNFQKLLTLVFFLLAFASSALAQNPSAPSRVRYVAALPSACNPATGEIAIKTSVSPTEFYYCDTTDHWQKLGTTTGSVTSVALTLPSEFSVTGSPVTSSGTLAASWASKAANFVFAGPTSGSAATPAFRFLVSDDIPALDAAKTTTGVFSTGRLGTGTANSSTFLRGDGTWAAPSGGVTSVGLSLPSIFSVSGSPVTTSGTLTGTLQTQTANFVFAGPTSGGAATPAFRALVASDIPSLTASKISDFSTATASELSSAGVKTLRTNLSGYWKLNEASGSRADSAGSSTLTDNNTVTSATGKRGNAAQFTRANSESLSASDSAALSTGDIDFTISCWLYMDSTANDMIAIAKDDSGGREFLLMYSNTASTFTFYVFNAAGSGVAVNSSPGGWTTATWYHVVVWHDAAADTLHMQINNGAVSTAATGGLVVNDSSTPFVIGGRYWPGAEGFWDGRIEEVGFWKRGLRASERLDLFNDTLAITYPFD
jgi:hypothetical protein